MTTAAVFGGSFNPPHVSHVLAAAYVLATQPVDTMIIVPAYAHPFGKALTPFEDRIEMCRRAFADLARVEVSDIEQRLGGESRTLRTLEAMHAEDPSRALRFVIGSDILNETHKWFGWERIVALAPPIVLGRVGHERPDAPVPVLPEAASRDLRTQIANGEPVDAWVPASVLRYIRERGLYRAP